MWPRQRDFPRELVINGKTWRVRFKRELVVSGTPCYGYCAFRERTIYIEMGQTPRERASTFWHELTHAIEVEYGVEIPHAMVYALEGPLSDVIHLNHLQWGRRSA